MMSGSNFVGSGWHYISVLMW